MFFDPESIDGLNPDRAGLLTLETPREVIAKRIEYDPLPENHACVATYIGERMIARAAIPEDLVEDFCETVSGPVYLALITFEAEPGIQGRFIAFVPMERIHKIRLKKEPWLASLPEYEEAKGFGLVEIGHVVRFEKDRKHPNDLEAETRDLFTQVLLGRSVSVIDKIIENL